MPLVYCVRNFCTSQDNAAVFMSPDVPLVDLSNKGHQVAIYIVDLAVNHISTLLLQYALLSGHP